MTLSINELIKFLVSSQVKTETEKIALQVVQNKIEEILPVVKIETVEIPLEIIQDTNGNIDSEPIEQQDTKSTKPRKMNKKREIVLDYINNNLKSTFINKEELSRMSIAGIINLFPEEIKPSRATIQDIISEIILGNYDNILWQNKND